MGDRPELGPPYASACLIFSYAQQRHLKAYISGRLALAGIDSRVPASVWLDAIYAILADAPHEILEKLHGQTVIAAARARPDRETWGLDPDQVALSNKITKLDKTAGPVPRVSGGAPGIKRGGFGVQP